MKLIFYLSFTPLLIFALIAILNSLTFPRLKPPAFPLQNPHVSVLIPMRNEAAVIGTTVKTLLAQGYPRLEILLLDDHSEDHSAETALRAANGDPRLKVLNGKPLPAGWFGKAWACHQLAERASGEYLLFTDADVNWQPGAISALLAEASKTRAALLTAWPQQETVTWAERLVVPLMGFSVLAYLPALAVHYVPWPVFAAAIGQCLLFKREAYTQIGGHTAIKHKIADDMALAYAIKKQGLRFRMAEASGLITCRMYHNWNEVRHGYAKNILAGHGNCPACLVFSTVFHWWQFVLPWFLLFSALFSNDVLTVTASGLLVTLGLATRALTAAMTRQRLQDALLLPVSVILMTLIVSKGLQWNFSGGPEWKGRKLSGEKP